MSQYIVTTPKNPQYTGKTYGILFQQGRAFVSDHTVNPHLGLSADEVVAKLKADFGYEVQPVGEPVPAVVIETRYAEVEKPEPAPVVEEPEIVDTPKATSLKKRDKAAAS